MEQVISWLNEIIWSSALIYLCLAAGLFYSILTRFAQVRHFKEMWRLLFSGEDSEDGISSFQALAVSLSGRVGMGNIAGVAAAIGFGGPGAVFWMWMVAFLGASTAYVESTLAQIYKERGQLTGQYRGGPAYYFEKGLGQKWYAILFAVSAIIACGVFLPGIQSNGVVNALTKITGEGSTVATSMFGDVGMNRLIGLSIILIILGFIIFGGIKRIAGFTQVIVPFMALGYIIMALIIVFANLDRVPELLGLIFNDAWSAQAGFGAAIGWGVKRGIYSNEAGQGTGPHAAAAAEVEHPAQQGLVQAFSVYVDTLFVCTATALMILITGMYNIQDGLVKEFSIKNQPNWVVLDKASGEITIDTNNYKFSDALQLAEEGKKFSVMADGKVVANVGFSKVLVEEDKKSVTTAMISNTFDSKGKLVKTNVEEVVEQDDAVLEVSAVKIDATEIYPRKDAKYKQVKDVVENTFVVTQSSNVSGIKFTPTLFLKQNVSATTKINSPEFTQMAVSSVFGSFGETFVAIASFFFAFTTILAYYYIAEVNVAYLTRIFKGRNLMIFVIKIVIMFMVAYGALNTEGYIWAMGDVGVGLMAWLNIVGILIIFFTAKPALIALKDYENQQQAQKDKPANEVHYTFNPRKLGIKNATFWEEIVDK